MTTVTVSPKFQIVIPARFRKDLGIDPGEKMQVISFKNRLELLPVVPMKSRRGFLKGLKAPFERERDRV
ncbi:MAG: AbrB/MazE/SpoVT family DNA-binding domain-containing protein [Candidatus Omnitrophica bacterium]|nr:AbrB/MazE/SpoVT family DNA-binding domain-containing protein [Candidatus Omnitrophota bacterium]